MQGPQEYGPKKLKKEATGYEEEISDCPVGPPSAGFTKTIITRSRIYVMTPTNPILKSILYLSADKK